MKFVSEIFKIMSKIASALLCTLKFVLFEESRVIRGAKLEDEISSAVLHQELDLDEITAVLRTRRLWWYGHWARTACHFVHQLHHAIGASRHQRSWEAKEDMVRIMHEK